MLQQLRISRISLRIGKFSIGNKLALDIIENSDKNEKESS